MRKLIIIGVVGVMSLVLATGAFADIKTLPLNCAGNYNVNTPAWTMDFDLGITFSEISHVYIDWSGEINAGLIQGMGYPEPTPFPGMLTSGIGAIPGEKWLRSASIEGGVSTYPYPEPFDLQSDFFLLEQNITWNSLLDGNETITIFMPNIMGDPAPISQGSVILNNATLIVEGTIIPEPATFVLLCLGISQIVRLKRHKPTTAI